MSLKVWLPLDGDLRNQGISDLTFSATSSNTTANASGKIGTCYTNNSHSAGGLISNKPILLGSQYSMCCWFKFTDLEANSGLGGGLISQHRHSKNTGFGLTIKYISSTTGYLSVNTGTGSARTYNTYYGTTLLQANTWYHACGTYDGTNIKIYLNGILEKTQAYNMSSPEDYLTIFCWSLNGNSGATIYGDYKLNGALNDVRIYDHCLSAAEVKEIAQGLILHYKLDGGVTTAKNLIKNGYGELGTVNWNSSANFSSEVPSNHPEIKRSVYSNITAEYIPIETTHNYKLEVYLKNSATSGTTYPSLYPYDIDKNFINYYNCPDGFNLSTMTFLTQELKSGDTKIYVDDLSKWNANSGTYYNYAAIFNYNDSTGYIYPNGTYTRDTPAFGSGTTAKTNLDKTNNIITLNSAYSGPTKPVGTAICAATAGGTYYYPFGGLAKSSLNDWTYKTVTIIPNNVTRLKYAKYIRYSTYDGTLHAGIKLIDLADDIDSTTISDSSGYGHNGICIDTTISSDNPRYSTCISCMGTTVDSTSNTITGAQFFYCNMEMPAMSAITVTWWGKNIAYGRGGIFETSNTIQTNTSKGTDYNTTAIANWDSTFGIYNGSSRVNIFSNFNKDGNWHHHAITFDGTNVNYYCDSILKQTSALTGTLPAWKNFCMGLGKAGGVWRQIKQYVSDLRIYCTPLLDTDIKSLYNIGMKIDKQQNIHAFDIEEKLQNIMYKSNFAIGAQLWQDGLNRYTQTNCQVNLTNDGIYIYRPANLNQTDNGNTMYGGLKIVNSTVDSIHVYDSNIDNIFNLQKGHTYIWIFHIKGSTTNAPSFQINNNMGWGGGGLSPTPSNVTIKNISSNFNGETEVWYKFTINDDIIKTCTSAYSSFVANNQYLSYKHFGWNWGYATTGNGTNIYITNIRLYDITNIPTGKLTKSGIIKFSSIFEVNNTIHLTKNEDLILNQFIER